ncbi:MAG: hypothetical protein ACYTGC_17130, partial [Planctomycetota bacterium]
SNVTYVVTVTNQGSAVARDVQVVCTLEDAMQFSTTSGATEGRLAAGAIQFQPLSMLAPGEKAVWRIEVVAGRPGDVRFATSLTSRMITRPVTETEATRFYE